MKHTITLLTALLFAAVLVHAEPPAAKAASERPNAAKAIEKPTTDAMRSLAQRICSGDKKALDTLRATVVELYRDIDYTTDEDRVQTNYVLVREAFDLLGREAAKGNGPAFDALKASLRETPAGSFAVLGMGIAAAGGHKESLAILLTPDEHQIMLSTAVGALMEPAAANIEPAVDFLIKVIQNPDNRPLYQMASDGLRGAAQKGNVKAKAALDELARALPKTEDAPAIPVTLKVGDLAPKLNVGQWVQGEPVKAFEKDKVYVVEFWATWCAPCRAAIPHLNEIHLKYQNKGLVVIGQNISENDQSRVKPFVAKMGNKMTYRVALDDVSKSKRGAMNETWMLAAGQSGIPAAFLVGKDGKIIWIGHPMQLQESMIEAAFHGR
jgi:thiol-disulfide isomerase/thioredoxin